MSNYPSNVCYCNTGYYCHVHNCYSLDKEQNNNLNYQRAETNLLIKGGKGEKGDKGEIGPHGIGIKGEPGLKGELGFKGDKGEPGPDGCDGKKGDKGCKGNSIVIDEVIILNEYKIDQIVNTYFNVIKTFYIHSDIRNNNNIPTNISGDMTTHIIMYDGKCFYDSGSIISIQGEKGESGSKGDRGADGIKGQKGIVGYKGEQGPQGIPGTAALKGDIGEKGNMGMKGEQGNQGYKGDIGPQGEKGSIGDKGIQGVKGLKGDIGPQGDKGDIGNDGPAGSISLYGIKHDFNSLNYNDYSGQLTDKRNIPYHNRIPEDQVNEGLYTLSTEYKIESIYIDPTFNRIRYKIKNEDDNTYTMITNYQTMHNDDFTHGFFSDGYAPISKPTLVFLNIKEDYIFEVPSSETVSSYLIYQIDNITYEDAKAKLLSWPIASDIPYETQGWQWTTNNPDLTQPGKLTFYNISTDDTYWKQISDYAPLTPIEKSYIGKFPFYNRFW